LQSVFLWSHWYRTCYDTDTSKLYEIRIQSDMCHLLGKTSFLVHSKGTKKRRTLTFFFVGHIIISQETVFNPYALSCGHLFCKLCACSAAFVLMFEGLKTASSNAKCPICREVCMSLKQFEVYNFLHETTLCVSVV